MKSLFSKRKVITLKLRNSILVLISTFVVTESASGKDCNRLESEMPGQKTKSNVNCVFQANLASQANSVEVDFRGSLKPSYSEYSSFKLKGAARSKLADFKGELWIDKKSNFFSGDYDGTFTYKSGHPLFAAGLVSRKDQTTDKKPAGWTRWEFENGAVLVGWLRYGLFTGEVDLTLPNQFKITGQVDNGKPKGHATLTNLTNDQIISIKSMPFMSIWEKLGYVGCSDDCYPRGAYDANTDAQLTSSLWKQEENRIAKEQKDLLAAHKETVEPYFSMRKDNNSNAQIINAIKFAIYGDDAEWHSSKTSPSTQNYTFKDCIYYEWETDDWDLYIADFNKIKWKTRDINSSTFTPYGLKNIVTTVTSINYSCDGDCRIRTSTYSNGQRRYNRKSSFSFGTEDIRRTSTALLDIQKQCKGFDTPY